MNIFKIITSTLTNYQPSDEEINAIPSFLFCRWLSGNKATIFAANEINKYYNIPIECQYKMVKYALNGKIKFIQFPKNIKTESSSDIDILQKHFNISYTKAQEYLGLISKSEIDEIRRIYINE